MKERKDRDVNSLRASVWQAFAQCCLVGSVQGDPLSSDDHSPHFSRKQTSCSASECMAQGHKVSK